MIRPPRSACPLLLPLLALLASCGEQEPPPPVAEVETELTQATLPFPEWRVLRLVWRPIAELGTGERPIVFVHLVDDGGEVVRTFDHLFPADWKVGEEVRYEIALYQSALAPPLIPGDYGLRLGLYAAGGRRWSLKIRAEERGRREYHLASISVPPVGAEIPAFEFSDSWGPLQQGADAQILGRRWLRGEGTLRAVNLEVPGSVRLQLDIPGPEDGWELRSESENPSLEITSTCSSTVESLSAPGRHELVMPVFSAGEELGCELRFLPDFELVAEGVERSRTLVLEVLAWSAAEL